MLMSWTAECHEGKITTLTVAADGHARASSLSESVVGIGNRERKRQQEDYILGKIGGKSNGIRDWLFLSV